MPYKITNLTDRKLYIGSTTIDVGSSVTVDQVDMDLAKAATSGLVSQEYLTVSAYTVTNVSTSVTVWVDGIDLGPGQSTVVSALPASASKALAAGILTYSIILPPSLGTVIGDTTTTTSSGVARKLDIIAIADGATLVAVPLTAGQIAKGCNLFINGLQQRDSAYSVSTNGATLPASLNIVAGDNVTFIYFVPTS